MALIPVIIGLIYLLVPMYQGDPRQTSSNQIRLGYVRNGDMGCGCGLALSDSDLWNNRRVFLHPMDESAYINLDGKNLRLRMTANSPEKKDLKVGDRSWENYVAGNINVRIDYTVTKICDPDDESCEVTYYRALLTIRRNRQKTVFKTIGLCGC